MEEVFCIELAGIAIRVRANYPSTRTFCRDYLTDREPEITVQVTPEDLAQEQLHAARQDARQGAAPQEYQESYLETLALYRKIVAALLPYGVLLYHGAVIAKDGRAIMFTAPSGTGKTTHIRLWQKVFGDQVTVVNGDKPLFKFTPEGIFACGTPWQGKENYGSNTMLPLAAICALQRDTVNHIEKVTLPELLPVLMQQTYRFKQREQVRQMMQLISRLDEVALYRLGCNMQPEAAVVAERGILHGDL